MKLSNALDRRGKFLYPEQNFLSNCPFHLFGQIVTVGFRPVGPHIIIDPNTRDVGGYDTEITKVVAQHLKFNLRFVEVKFGLYIKNNDSYSPGSANAMVRYHYVTAAD